MDYQLDDFELKVLREVSGEKVPGLQWGAAMGQAVEVLKGFGLVEKVGTKYVITATGRAQLGNK